MDCIVHEIAKSRTPLSDFHFTLKESGVLVASVGNLGDISKFGRTKSESDHNRRFPIPSS